MLQHTQATTSRVALRVAALDPASSSSSSRSARSRSDLSDYLSSLGSKSIEQSREEGHANAFEAAAEVAAADSLLPLPWPPPRRRSSRSPAPPPTPPPPRVHVIVTSNGSPYLNYQTRLLFASWQRVKATTTGGGEQTTFDPPPRPSSSPSSSPATTATSTMAGFTRILHRTADDALSRGGEEPTQRVAPRTPACDEWCPFPVADRSEAVRSFFAAVRSSSKGMKLKIPGMEEEDEESAASLFYFLAETDYLFLRPLQVPSNLFFPPAASSSSSSSLSSSSTSSSHHHQSPPPPLLFDGVAFPFGYIQPRSAVVAPILERLFSLSRVLGEGGNDEKGSNKKAKNIGDDEDVSSSSSSSSPPTPAVPNTGPSPVLLPLAAWFRLLPAWVSFTEAIEKDPEAREVLGWIREMVR